MKPDPTAPSRASAQPWHAQAVLPALVPGACLSRALLISFSQAMRRNGLPLQTQRLRYDRIYARQCLSLAHCQGDAELRLLALQLFERYQPGAEA
jgi:hypothetical protein